MYSNNKVSMNRRLRQLIRKQDLDPTAIYEVRCEGNDPNEDAFDAVDRHIKILGGERRVGWYIKPGTKSKQPWLFEFHCVLLRPDNTLVDLVGEKGGCIAFIEDPNLKSAKRADLPQVLNNTFTSVE